MSGQVFLLVAKVVAVMTSALLGIFALAVEQKIIQKRPWTGVALLLGIVLSGLIAVALEIVQARVAAEESKEEAEEYRTIIAEINRTLSVIDELEVYVLINLPNSIPEVSELQAAIEAYIEDNPNILKETHSKSVQKDGVRVLSYSSGKAGTISFDALASNLTKKIEGFRSLAFRQITVEFRSGDLADNGYRPLMSVKDGHADFVVTSIFPNSSSIEYDVETGFISVRQHVTMNEALWHSNGAVASLSDLLGSQFILTIGFHDAFLSVCRDSSNDLSGAKSILEYVSLNFGRGRRMDMKRNDFEPLSVSFLSDLLEKPERDMCDISFQAIIRPEFFY